MHAETGGVAGALIPPASYSGSGLGKTDLSPSDSVRIGCLLPYKAYARLPKKAIYAQYKAIGLYNLYI